MICQVCDRPLDSGSVCSSCIGTASRILGAVPSLVGELRTTLARQGRRGVVPAARTSSERPLPYDVGASNVLGTLGAILWPWVALVVRERGGDVQAMPLTECASFLARPANLEVIRQQDTAGRLVNDLLDWQTEATRIVDLPAERWYAGPCDLCGNDLYASPGAVSVACDTLGCSGTYEVAARREWLLGAVSDRLATTAQVSSALTSWKAPVTPSVIRGLVHRGRLQVKGHDPRSGDPLYRVGDVIDLLTERAKK